MYEPVLNTAHARATEFLSRLSDRPVNATAPFSELVATLGGPFPERGADPSSVIDALARDAAPGIVSTAGPRYFGFVTGGSYPVAVAADWLVSTWDQNGGLFVMSPAVSALEQVTMRWVLDALSLPQSASVGFVTGAHTANITALAAARHEVLRRAGWDVEKDGLQGAPRVTVIAGAEAHSSIPAACRSTALPWPAPPARRSASRGSRRGWPTKGPASGANSPAQIAGSCACSRRGRCSSSTGSARSWQAPRT